MAYSLTLKLVMAVRRSMAPVVGTSVIAAGAEQMEVVKRAESTTKREWRGVIEW
jgi:hypothetical protein